METHYAVVFNESKNKHLYVKIILNLPTHRIGKIALQMIDDGDRELLCALLRHVLGFEEYDMHLHHLVEVFRDDKEAENRESFGIWKKMEVKEFCHETSYNSPRIKRKKSIKKHLTKSHKEEKDWGDNVHEWDLV